MVDYVTTNALSMLGGDDFDNIPDIVVLDARFVQKIGNVSESINGNKTFEDDLIADNIQSGATGEFLISNTTTDTKISVVGTATSGILDFEATDPLATGLYGQIRQNADTKIEMRVGGASGSDIAMFPSLVTISSGLGGEVLTEINNQTKIDIDGSATTVTNDTITDVATTREFQATAGTNVLTIASNFISASQNIGISKSDPTSSASILTLSNGALTAASPYLFVRKYTSGLFSGLTAQYSHSSILKGVISAGIETTSALLEWSSGTGNFILSAIGGSTNTGTIKGTTIELLDENDVTRFSQTSAITTITNDTTSVISANGIATLEATNSDVNINSGVDTIMVALGVTEIYSTGTMLLDSSTSNVNLSAANSVNISAVNGMTLESTNTSGDINLTSGDNITLTAASTNGLISILANGSGGDIVLNTTGTNGRVTMNATGTGGDVILNGGLDSGIIALTAETVNVGAATDVFNVNINASPLSGIIDITANDVILDGADLFIESIEISRSGNPYTNLSISYVQSQVATALNTFYNMSGNYAVSGVMSLNDCQFITFPYPVRFHYAIVSLDSRGFSNFTSRVLTIRWVDDVGSTVTQASSGGLFNAQRATTIQYGGTTISSGTVMRPTFAWGGTPTGGTIDGKRFWVTFHLEQV
jgi:hypothetical protein